MAGLELVEQEADASHARRHAGEIHRRAEMIGVANRDGADAVHLGLGDSILHQLRADDLSDAVTSVDERNRPAIHDRLRLSYGVRDAVLDARQIPAQAQHAVRLVAPKVGLYQRVRQQACVFHWHSGTRINSGSKIGKAFAIDATG